MSSESQSQTALASLHATYTDSEGEAEDSEGEEESSRDKQPSPSKESSHSSMDDYAKETKQTSKLVSYATEAHEDEDMSDSDEESKSSSDSHDDSPDHKVVPVGAPPLSPVSFHRSLLNVKKEDLQLPPEAIGKCSKSLQEKIGELYEKKKNGKDMNASIQKRKDFRNPSIYEKLIQFCNIDEKGTNYAPESYDPHCWGPESFYEELAKRQKEEMDKREKEKKMDRTKVVEFISGTVKKQADSSSDAAKRKSKWDVGLSQLPSASMKAAQLVTPHVLPVPTGTKPTVISAFGTISKKAKI